MKVKQMILLTATLILVLIGNGFSEGKSGDSKTTDNIKGVSTMATTAIFKSEEGKQKILGVYDLVMSSWAVEYKDRFIDTAFGRTHLIECGDESKEAVLLFHGSSSNSLMWLADMTQLSKDFHVFSVDILGEAGKSEEVRLDLHNAEFSEWVKDLLKRMNIDKSALIGNSYGGWVALKFATVYPEMVSKIVLIAPSGITDVKASYMETLMSCVMKGPEGMLEMNRLIYGTDKLPQQVVDFTNLVMENFNPITEALPLLTTEQLSRLTMPVMYIAGENDIIFDSKQTAEILSNTCEKVTNRIIANNGHVVYNTMELVIPFLKGPF
ncbi:MAG TPA: alpha/beta hydrolase [Thermotogota bacterium]|nr:alpha/beta hydrolase [Thermotogota bacterium]